jgi:hypothetical protein
MLRAAVPRRPGPRDRWEGDVVIHSDDTKKDIFYYIFIGLHGFVRRSRRLYLFGILKYITNERVF